MSGLIGKQIGAYQIVALLGAGGMGEVYRARDTKLGRDVAIKVLPRRFVEDQDRLARFEREARTLASLNHPNIATIHGLEDADGVRAIVLELVEGETLAERIARLRAKGSAVPVAEALAIARQIADALEAAHEKGIVHRDLKPANVKVTPAGLVKVLDFGLAKVAAGGAGETSGLSGSPTAALDATRDGVLLGTAAYMSPEQARGQAVDKRTDIWAFGCLLYEMITGRTTFPGQTVSDHIAAVLKSDPDWTALPAATPASIQRLLRRCLEKDQTRRWRDIADAKIDLDEASAERASRLASAWRRPAVLSAAAVVVAAAVGGFALASRRDRSGVLRLTNPVQVAATVGFETLPAWSPDGRTMAYQSDQAGNNDIWIAQVGGTAVNRTAEFPGGDEMPRWSPDGTQIAFWSARAGGGVFLMPALGGSARKIGPARPDVAAGVAWSPDGTEIAYPVIGSEADGGRRVEFLNIRTNVIHAVAIPPTGRGVFGGSLDMSWSPDGRFIAVLQANSYNNQTATVSTLQLKDEKFRQVTESSFANWSPRWLPDSRTILFTSNRGGTMDVWQQRITDEGAAAGEAVRVTTGLDALQIAVAPDGKRLAYAKGKQRLANVWRVPILENQLAKWADARQLTFDQAWVEAFDVSPDGQQIAIQSDRGGNADVWILPASGGEIRQLTTDPASDLWPAWSPDGRDIAFYSNRGAGGREVWAQSVVGGPARRVTHDGGSFPRWSKDGTNIFFDRRGIWIVPASGGESHEIMKTGSAEDLGTMEFSLAPDGRSFAFAAGRLPVRRIWRASVSGADRQPLTREQADAPSWSRDGHWVYFTTYRDSPGTSYQLERPGLNIWRVSSDGAREEPVTQLVGRRGWLGQNISNDGRYVYFTWREDVADIWMMDVVRP